MTAKKIDLLISGMDGHRRQYIEVLERELHAATPDLNLKVLDLKVVNARPWSINRTQFYVSLDDHWIKFGFVALLRTLLGCRTVGMFHRAGDCFRKKGYRQRIMRMLFQMVSRLPNVEILTVLPFEVEPRFSKIATNWIYELQLWDLPSLGDDATAETPLSAEVRAAAGDRRIVLALGRQNRNKAFDEFARIWNERRDLREKFLFVAAGKVLPDCAAAAREFVASGGLVFDRYLEDSELFGLYRVADIVWTCYSPDYDMSSGIYDRAVQMGLPSIVRAGSLLDVFSCQIEHPTLAIPYAEPATAADQIVKWSPSRTPAEFAAKRAQEMRAHSLSVLRRALGLPSPVAR